MDDGQILDESTLKENLREARLARGLTQAAVAETLGISVTAYQKIERGKTFIINKRYRKCAEIFGISMAELVNGFKPVKEATALLVDMEESYGRKLREQESVFRDEIQKRALEAEKMEESIKEKDAFIATQKLLIDQLMGMRKD